ncbi:sensor histidine kinase [Gordonia sp. NPDC003376]
MNAATEQTAGRDLERVQRIGARFLGAGLLAYLAVSWPVMVSASVQTAPWWTPVSVVLAVGPGLLLVIAGFRPGTAWLGPLAVACSLGYIAAVALWFVAWTGTPLADPDQSALWLSTFPGMASMVAMLVYPRYGVMHLVVATLLLNIAQQMGRYGHLNGELVWEVCWAVGFTGVFLAIARVAVRTAALLDRTRAVAHRVAAEAAAATARQAEQARFDAVIHDRAIASLLAVDRGRPDVRLAAQAQSAVDAMDDLANGVIADGPSTVPAPIALRRIRAAARDFGEDIDIDIESATDDDTRYPAETVGALIEAMGEALRNVGRHAGAGASSAVLCRAGEDSISMAVVDDGSGFDPDHVVEGRLGIAAGIRGRMDAVPGGSAVLRSSVGRGTTVGLQWVRP